MGRNSQRPLNQVDKKLPVGGFEMCFKASKICQFYNQLLNYLSSHIVKVLTQKKNIYDLSL